MKEELSQKLVESLDKVQSYIEATEDFVVEQAPLIAQEIISLGRLESAWPVVCAAFVLLIAICVLTYCAKVICSDCGNDAHFTIGFVSAIATFGSGLLFVCGIDRMIEPWFCPRLYVLHEIAKML